MTGAAFSRTGGSHDIAQAQDLMSDTYFPGNARTGALPSSLGIPIAEGPLKVPESSTSGYIPEDARGIFEQFYDHTLAEIVGVPPRLLFHYTSPKGLVGILSSGEIFATNAFFTNDVAEIRLSLSMFRNAAQERVSELPPGPVKLAFQMTAQRITTALAGTSGIFVACFSTEGDDNAQWSAYGGTAGGYNLGLDWHDLSRVATERELRLVPCVYDIESQKRYVERAIAEFETLVHTSVGAETAAQQQGSAIRECVALFFEKVSAFAPLLKDPGFKHEHEWRLVKFTNDASLMEFEPRENVIRPRVRLDMKHSSAGRTIPCLRQVTVGPTPHLDIAPDAVKALLLSLGYPLDEEGGPSLPVFPSRSTLRIV